MILKNKPTRTPAQPGVKKTTAEKLTSSILKQGQPVSQETARILEEGLKDPQPELILDVPAFEGSKDEPLPGCVVQDQSEPVIEPTTDLFDFQPVEVETTTTKQEPIMENIDKIEPIVEATPSKGIITRTWGWIRDNKGKIAAGTAAVAAVGVGVYYLARSGNTGAIGTAVTEVTTAITDGVSKV